MNPRPATLPQWLLPMTLIGIAAGLSAWADEATEAPVPEPEPQFVEALDLHVRHELIETILADADTGPVVDIGDQPSTPIHFRLGEQPRLPGLGALRPARHEGLAFGIGPQVLETGNPADRLAREMIGDLIGDSLLERHRYALIGFAGYRGYRGWAVGPEAWVNADPSYRIRGLGLAVRDLRAGPLRMDLRLGATKQQNQIRAINGGVELRWYKP